MSFKSFLILFVVCMFQLSCSETSFEHLAYTEYQKSRLAEIKQLNQQIKHDSENADLYLERGRAKLFSAIVELEKQALEDLNRSIELDPNNLTAYFVRAVYYRRHGTHDQQLNDLQTAIEIEPESSSAYYKLGLYHRNQKDDQQALTSFSKAVEFDPKLHGGFYMQGIIYKEQGQFQKAIDLFTQSLKIKPNWAVYHYHRGEAYEEIGEIEKAIADYRQVIRYDNQQFGVSEAGARKHLNQLLKTNSTQN